MLTPNTLAAASFIFLITLTLAASQKPLQDQHWLLPYQQANYVSDGYGLHKNSCSYIPLRICDRRDPLKSWDRSKNRLGGELAVKPPWVDTDLVSFWRIKNYEVSMENDRFHTNSSTNSTQDYIWSPFLMAYVVTAITISIFKFSWMLNI